MRTNGLHAGAGQGASRTRGLRPRAVGALSIVAASLFLLLCLANYGHGGFETAGDAPWHLDFAGWFVEVFGAGAFVLVLLPLVWGLVVYFREDTPSLSMRAAGTVLLACSVSMVSGLVQGTAEMSWAGSVGEYTVALTQGLGGVMGNGIALALAWAATVTLFMASLVWATDWWFHTLRKGPITPVISTSYELDVEPPRAELRDDHDDDEVYEREMVSVDSKGAEAAVALDTPAVDVAEPAPVEEAPEGFSMRPAGDRMVVRGPSGYAGVEFLPPSDELAAPEPPEERFLNEVEPGEERLVDDELELVTLVEEAEEVEEVVENEPEAPVASIEDTLAADRTEPAYYTPEEAPHAEAAQVEAGPAETVSDTEERPRSGIGLPEDSPFVDEFFAVDVLVGPEPGGDDGATADGEVEAAFGTSIPATESPESPVAEPAPETAFEAAPAPVEAPSQPVIVDELLFADAYLPLDDEIPAPVVQRSAPAEPAPSADDAATPDLASALRGMQLDPLFQDAVEVVLEAGRGSAMTLQRRFGIGHGRGLRLLQQMEEAGILAAEDDAGTREVLIARSDWEALSGSRSA